MLMDICFTIASCAVCVLQGCTQFYTARGKMKETPSVNQLQVFLRCVLHGIYQILNSSSSQLLTSLFSNVKEFEGKLKLTIAAGKS